MPSEAPGVIKTPSTYHCADTLSALFPRQKNTTRPFTVVTAVNFNG
jgi:hypothetical protein